ncbi:MAG TPA: hypothetical protein VGE47_05540 [Burkholderiaceae bacterium]
MFDSRADLKQGAFHMRVTGKLLAAMAVSSLVLAQPVVAATRSMDALPSASVELGDRVAAPIVASEEAGTAVPVVLLFAVFGALAIGIIAALDKDNDGIVDSFG